MRVCPRAAAAHVRFRQCPAGAWKGSERMMCGQTMKTMQVVMLSRVRAASRFLLTAGLVGASII